MPSSDPTPRRTRIRRRRLTGLLVILAVITAALGQQRPASVSSPAAPLADIVRTGDSSEPAELTKLDAGLRGALRDATRDAANEGIQVSVDSGWRSPEHQARLLREAVATYGSEEEAARWVATPGTSAHVSGEAVDVGPPAAAAWLASRGAAYGLCQIYANEPWHFELRPDAAAEGCPPVYADPTHDPRMQQR